ncbi:MAG: lytic murein transglycosylase [Xanthomonadales bacterium]|nr:lytic murein transglycosylase [Xanthomonadales bacterium]
MIVRAVMLFAVLAILPGLAAHADPASSPARTGTASASTLAPAAPAFRACLQSLSSPARAAGVDGDSFRRFTDGLEPDPEVLVLLDAQPEFTTPVWDYLAALVDAERVADGRAMLAEHADLLARIEAAHGVDAATVVAVWGVESDYGRITGRRQVLRSLATLACDGRRQAFFRGELFAFLRLLQDGDLTDPQLGGSWAGAFGQTQFMPSTYRRVAVDFDGDGRRDLVGSIADALASTANYLRQSGWRPGRSWGREVRLPDGFNLGQAGRRNKATVATWSQRGVRLPDGAALTGAGLDGATRAAVIVPAGRDGPAFLVLANYDAVFSYNAAESYALAIVFLAEQLRGGPVLPARPWPTDDPGLSRQQRRQLQHHLLALGHDIGEVDSLIGDRSRRAIVAEQQRLGIEPADGRAGQRILRALQPDQTTPTRDATVPDEGQQP